MYSNRVFVESLNPEFLLVDSDNVPEDKSSFIRKKMRFN